MTKSHYMKALKIIYYAFFVCIALLALLLIFSIFPVPGNYKILVVQSGSMEPVIKTGSIVAVKPAEEYSVGDIITFGQLSKTKIPTTHRILEIKNESGKTLFVTKGDANDSADTALVAKSEVIGKVLFDVPYLGYAVAAGRKPFGFMLIIVVPAVFVIYDEIRKIIKEIKKLRANPVKSRQGRVLR
jgi:signal peptidase